MKRLLLLLAVLFTGTLNAQTVTLPIDFEAGPYTFTDFDGGGASVVSNPSMTGINMSANVGQMVKSAGQVWGGSYLTMAGPIDFSTNKTFKMKVWSPRVGARVLLKVENASNGGIFYEKEDTSTVANMWEELTFDYNLVDTSQSFEKLVLIWDLGVAGDGSPNFTFHFDDIQLVANSGPVLNQIDLPITFDDTMVDYTMTDFGGNASSVVPDPVNPPNMVGKAIKTAAAQTWAGSTIGTPAGLASAIPFASGDTWISVRVYSPDAGVPVRLKAEDKTDPNVSVETEAMTTTSNAWETLWFDFSNEASGTAAINFANTYDLLSIFFNFGTDGATAGEKTYHFDDVMFGAPVGIANAEIAGLRYFPNPVNDGMRVEAETEMTSIVVFDLMGREVLRQLPGTQQAQLDLNNLETGVYLVRVSSELAESHFRIVKK